jgi:hypothetical protein
MCGAHVARGGCAASVMPVSFVAFRTAFVFFNPPAKKGAIPRRF